MSHAALQRLALLFGALEGLFAARLLLKLLAARPANPIFAALLAATQPLVGPLAFLDAQQPRFGAILEFSTLVWMLLFGIGVVALRIVGARRSATPIARRASHR